jgi:hypothetical protein
VDTMTLSKPKDFNLAISFAITIAIVAVANWDIAILQHMQPSQLETLMRASNILIG